MLAARIAVVLAAALVAAYGFWASGLVATLGALWGRHHYTKTAHGDPRRADGRARRRTIEAYLKAGGPGTEELLALRNDPRVTWRDAYVVNSRGMTLHTQRWAPAGGQAPKGLVCALHGYSDHISWLFAHKLHHLAAAGYVVQALDYEGHGQSDGLHIHVPNFKQLVLDCAAVFEQARREFPSDFPKFLYGESMGGAVALELSLLEEAVSPWDGMVLVAPMAKIADDMKPPELVVRVLKQIAPLLPTLPAVPTKDVVAQAVKHPHIRELSLSSPLTYGRKPRLATALQLLEVSTELERRLADVTTPFLVMHGDNDVVTDPEISRALYEQASAEDKTMIVYEGAWHSIFFDDDHIADKARADVVEWLGARS